ncbi:MAG: RloB family protein [Candidatus Hydrogenedentota bacterium]
MLTKALDLAERESIRVLLSNPSFEFWLLCHVKNANSLKSSLEAPQAADKALRQVLGFGKDELNADERRFDKLVEEAKTATSVAREIHCQHHAAVPDIRNANPCTTVYLLVEYLLAISCQPP